MNKQFLIGNLGNNPKTHTFDSGNKVVNFSLATTYSYKSKKSGEYVNLTDWHNIVASGPVVPYIEKHFKKGSKAYVLGRSRQREYLDDNQTKRYVTEVIVDEIRLLDSHQPSNTQNPIPTTTNGEEPDDLPF